MVTGADIVTVPIPLDIFMNSFQNDCRRQSKDSGPKPIKLNFLDPEKMLRIHGAGTVRSEI